MTPLFATKNLGEKDRQMPGHGSEITVPAKARDAGGTVRDNGLVCSSIEYMRHEIVPLALQHGTGNIGPRQSQGPGFGAAPANGIDLSTQPPDHQRSLALQ